MYDTNLPELVGKLPYFDTIAVRVSRPPDAPEVSRLRELCRHLKVTTRTKPIRGKKLPCRLELHGPSNASIALLDMIYGDESYLINELHVALDLCVEKSWEAEVLGQFICRHLVKLWNGMEIAHYKYTTKYTGDKSWSTSKLVVYSDLYSKVARLPCVHVEWRSNGSPHVKQQGVEFFSNLLSFDFCSFWRKRLVLEWIDPRALARRFAGRRRVLPPRVIRTSKGGLAYDDDYRTGFSLLRYHAMGGNGLEAQLARDWLKTESKCKPRDVMVRMDNECLLPRPYDNVREMQLTLQPLLQSAYDIQHKSRCGC